MLKTSSLQGKRKIESKVPKCKILKLLVFCYFYTTKPLIVRQLKDCSVRYYRFQATAFTSSPVNASQETFRLIYCRNKKIGDVQKSIFQVQTLRMWTCGGSETGPTCPFPKVVYQGRFFSRCKNRRTKISHLGTFKVLWNYIQFVWDCSLRIFLDHQDVSPLKELSHRLILMMRPNPQSLTGKFTVQSTMALGCCTSLQGYIGWRAGPTPLCRSRLYIPQSRIRNLASVPSRNVYNQRRQSESSVPDFGVPQEWICWRRKSIGNQGIIVSFRLSFYIWQLYREPVPYFVTQMLCNACHYHKTNIFHSIVCFRRYN